MDNIATFTRLTEAVLHEEFYNDNGTLKFSAEGSSEDKVLEFIDVLTAVKGDNAEFIKNRGRALAKWNKVYYGYNVVDDKDMRLSVLRIPKTHAASPTDPSKYDQNASTTHFDYENFTDKEYNQLIDKAVDGFLSKDYTNKTKYDVIVYPSSRVDHVIDIVKSIQAGIGYEVPSIELKKIPLTTTGWNQVFGMNDSDNSDNLVSTLYDILFKDSNVSSTVTSTAKQEINDAIQHRIKNGPVKGAASLPKDPGKHISIATHLRSRQPEFVRGVIDDLAAGKFFEKFPTANKDVSLSGRLDRYANKSVFRQHGFNRKIGEGERNILFVDDNINTGATYTQLQGIIDKSKEQHWDFFYLIKQNEYGAVDTEIGQGAIEELEQEKAVVTSSIVDILDRLKKLGLEGADMAFSSRDRYLKAVESTEKDLEASSKKLQGIDSKLQGLNWQGE